jgi:hypothetical protein
MPKNEMSIGIIVDKSNATGRERVLPPTPYLKTDSSSVQLTPLKKQRKSFFCKLCSFFR